MSGLGMLASALAGGAGAVYQQATGDIDQGRKIDLAKEQADIDVQKQARISEAQAALNLDTNQRQFVQSRANSIDPETLSAADTVATQAAKTARKVKVEELTDSTLNTAARKKAADDATAAHDVAADLTKRDANDPLLMKASWKVAMNDPRVASAYASAMAAAGASGAAQRLSEQNLTDLKRVSDRAAQVQAIQDQLSTEKDPDLRAGMQQQLGDLLSGGRDATKFLEAVNRAQDNARDALKLLSDPLATDEAKRLAGQQLRNAQALAQQAAALGGFNLDSEANKPIIQQPAIDDLLKNPKTAPQFDQAFGRPGLAAQILEAHKNDKPSAPKSSTDDAPTGLLSTAVGAPNSAAAKSAARRDTAKKESDDKSAAKAARISQLAAELLKTGTVQDIERFKRSDDFMSLDSKAKAAVYDRFEQLLSVK